MDVDIRTSNCSTRSASTVPRPRRPSLYVSQPPSRRLLRLEQRLATPLSSDTRPPAGRRRRRRRDVARRRITLRELRAARLDLRELADGRRRPPRPASTVRDQLRGDGGRGPPVNDGSRTTSSASSHCPTTNRSPPSSTTASTSPSSPRSTATSPRAAEHLFDDELRAVVSWRAPRAHRASVAATTSRGASRALRQLRPSEDPRRPAPDPGRRRTGTPHHGRRRAHILIERSLRVTSSR